MLNCNQTSSSYPGSYLRLQRGVGEGKSLGMRLKVAEILLLLLLQLKAVIFSLIESLLLNITLKTGDCSDKMQHSTNLIADQRSVESSKINPHTRWMEF